MDTDTNTMSVTAINDEHFSVKSFSYGKKCFVFHTHNFSESNYYLGDRSFRLKKFGLYNFSSNFRIVNLWT